MSIIETAKDLTTSLRELPLQPGIYQMFSTDGELIYVGKAKNLRNRVRSYFQKNAHQQSPKVQVMVPQIAKIDYIITDSEIEALLLEATLIKRHQPKYNILLRDNKQYPWIGIEAGPFPRLFVTRNPEKRGKTKYFGPYTSSAHMYETLQVIRKHFPLRQRRKPLFQTRPCMNYYIGSCMGPCQGLVTPEEYAEVVKQVELFLNGKNDELLELLAEEMVNASEELNFEWAAKLRDRFQVVEKVKARQKVVSDDVTVNQDIIGTVCDELRCSITVLTVRRGKLIASRSHEIPLTNGATVEEAYSSFLYQYYQDKTGDDIPDELILQYPAEDEDILKTWLSMNHKRKVQLLYPKLGAKKELIGMAMKNSQDALEQSKRYDSIRLRNDPTRALIEVQEALGLPDFPARMECYDISHIQGNQTVASMVVFTDGQADKAQYRRFKINTAEGRPDDFKSMAEVIRRRFAHSGDSPDAWEDPDLVIIDGGKGQLSAAVAALRAQGIQDQPIISLAKRFEEVYLPGQSHPVILPRDSAALFLLQQIRDEAHRFAITYHRTLRSKRATDSELDTIAGIGEKRKKQLLTHFGSKEKIMAASASELARATGMPAKTALKIYQALHSNVS